MRTYRVHEACVEFVELVNRALSGELQRVVHDSGQAVVVVSEDEWNERAKSTPTLADLFLQHAGEEGYDDVLNDRSWYKQDRELGADFLKDD